MAAMKMGLPHLRTPIMVCRVCGRMEIPSWYCTRCKSNDWDALPEDHPVRRPWVRRRKRSRPNR
jgi:hypothetical protein